MFSPSDKTAPLTFPPSTPRSVDTQTCIPLKYSCRNPKIFLPIIEHGHWPPLHSKDLSDELVLSDEMKKDLAERRTLYSDSGFSPATGRGRYEPVGYQPSASDDQDSQDGITLIGNEDTSRRPSTSSLERQPETHNIYGDRIASYTYQGRRRFNHSNGWDPRFLAEVSQFYEEVIGVDVDELLPSFPSSRRSEIENQVFATGDNEPPKIEDDSSTAPPRWVHLSCFSNPPPLYDPRDIILLNGERYVLDPPIHTYMHSYTTLAAETSSNHTSQSSGAIGIVSSYDAWAPYVTRIDNSHRRLVEVLAGIVCHPNGEVQATMFDLEKLVEASSELGEELQGMYQQLERELPRVRLSTDPPSSMPRRRFTVAAEARPTLERGVAYLVEGIRPRAVTMTTVFTSTASECGELVMPDPESGTETNELLFDDVQMMPVSEVSNNFELERYSVENFDSESESDVETIVSVPRNFDGEWEMVSDRSETPEYICELIHVVSNWWY